jgi:hypothetical protein
MTTPIPHGATCGTCRFYASGSCYADPPTLIPQESTFVASMRPETRDYAPACRHWRAIPAPPTA